jgi:predicted esterase
MAFSPGFMAPEAQRGQPPIYISHGKKDAVLPIEKCSRRLVPQLQDTGFEVNYHEFDGPHSVPDAIKSEAVKWWLALSPAKES